MNWSRGGCQPTPGRPLAGVRILDLSTSYAGPTASMLLADLGADVVKVERPGIGDDTRDWGPPFVGGQSPWFMSANRGKRSIALNLRDPGGKKVLVRLLDLADVLLVSFNPTKLAALGLEPNRIRAGWPRLIYCALSGFGSSGPDARLSGYDLIAQARSGLMSVTGPDGGSPQRVSTALSDVTTGIVAALAIVSAIRAQDETGTGVFLDVSLLDADLALMAPRIASFLAGEPEPRPTGATDSVLAIYQSFETADRPIVVAVGNDKMWQRFCDILGLDECAKDPRLATNAGRRRERGWLIPVIQDRLSRRSAAEWLECLHEGAIPASPILSLSEVVADAQVRARGTIHWLDDPVAGRVGVVGPPWRSDADDTTAPHPAPQIGQHSREVLTEIGFEQSEIDALIRDEVVWSTS